ncbi:hypothetical protein BGZ47_008550 [Haplosporangium gracile]|nr:hypothetical protein BGZ47_008550 [Haplosporangium gracile]
MVAGLKEQLKDAEKDAKEQIQVKEGVILALQKQLSSLAQHELAKVEELTKEIERETTLLLKTESQLLDLQKTSTEQTHQIEHLDTVVSQTRSEFLTDRQRRASETEESVLAEGVLESQILALCDNKSHLEEKVSVEHQSEVEMEEQVKELVAWKQNATAQCDTLTLTITKLEKEVRLLKGVVTQCDKDDANAQAHLENLRGQVQSLENARVMLQREVEKKDAMIEEFEETLTVKTKEAKKVAVETR